MKYFLIWALITWGLFGLWLLLKMASHRVPDNLPTAEDLELDTED